MKTRDRLTVLCSSLFANRQASCPDKDLSASTVILILSDTGMCEYCLCFITSIVYCRLDVHHYTRQPMLVPVTA
jgi:hypothetical protein